MPIIDKGMFHNYDICKQLALCDVLISQKNQKPLQSIDTSFASFSPFYKGGEEKGKKRQIKGKAMAQWMNFLWNNSFITLSIYLSCVKNLEP